MALTITPVTYYQLGKCDALIDLEGTWTGNSAGTESDFFKEGAGCLGFTIRVVGNNDILYTKASGTWDLSGVKHLRLWFLCSTPNAINVDDPADPANAGIQFFVGDATNTAYYKVGGKTSYPGGWYSLVIDLSRTQDSGTKPTNMLCTKIGLRMNMTVAPKNVDNVWIDNLIYCAGLKCTSDTQFSLQDIFDKDNAATGAWGVIRKIAGIYYLTGSLVFGDNAGTLSSDFKDTTQVVVFEDRKVNAALYDLNIVGNSTGTTKFQLGELAGTAGISGCNIRTQSFTQTPKFKITCTDAGLADARYQTKLYGCVIGDSDIITLPLATANREVLNCSFEKCGEILASTCKFENSNVISADDRGVRIAYSGATHGVKNCTFINCPKCVHVNFSGSVTFDNLKFSGSNGSDKFDIEHSAAGALTVNCINDSNPQYVTETGGGSTTIVNTKILTIRHVKTGNEPTNYVRCCILKQSDNSEIMNLDATVADDLNPTYYKAVKDDYTYLGPVAVIVRAREKGWLPFETVANITDAGLDISAVWLPDPNYQI